MSEKKENIPKLIQHGWKITICKFYFFYCKCISCICTRKPLLKLRKTGGKKRFPERFQWMGESPTFPRCQKVFGWKSDLQSCNVSTNWDACTILILTLFILQYLSVIEVIPIYICKVTTPKHIVDKALYIKAVHAPMEKLWTTQSKTKDLYEHINPTMAKAGTMPF